jgi:peptidoglycan/LPS O-acetylase OafA/YrhL
METLTAAPAGRVSTEAPDAVVRRGVPGRHFRPELHGVRGVAILGVVLFHLFGAGRISGGIDIFLAITGMLFTAMLLREATETGGRIDVLRYAGRLARRILVPAAVVIVATTAIGLAVFPSTRHAQLWAEARGSLLYFENIELINSQLAYGAAGPETSPFQHFWSLSVQGQFYLVWPVVAVVAVLIARWLKVPAVRVMAVMVGLVLAASLALALYVGSFDQDKAYLMSTTRAWQLAFGGLLGLFGASLALPRRFRLPAGWLGLALIVSCGFVLDGAQLFPGLWSLWPLLGLTLVLASAGPDGGQQDPAGHASRFLSSPGFAWIGNHAYALYLWHWPLLIFYLEVREREAVGFQGAAFILALSCALAWLTHRLIETPLKNLQVRVGRHGLRKLNIATVAIAVIALMAGGAASTAALRPAPREYAAVTGWDAETYPGGSVEAGSTDVPDVDFVPAVEDLSSELPDYYDWGCRQSGSNAPGSDEAWVCEDPNKPEEPTATVVLAAGSHAGHWTQGFRSLAAQYGWELLIVDRPSCPLGIAVDPADTMCEPWQDNLIEWLDTADVDLVITPGTRMAPSDRPEYILEGAPERWEQITATGADLLLLRGTPRSDINAADCLAEGGRPADCGPPVAQISAENPLENTALPEGTHVVDVVDHVCPAVHEGAERCSAVVGNVVVWHDKGHLTNTFAGTMAPVLDAHMREVPGLRSLFPR